MLYKGVKIVKVYQKNGRAGRTCFIFWNNFTVLTLLYNIEFYLQHALQFNHNVHVHTLVILPTFKISA
jgi:hypothetical protein